MGPVAAVSIDAVTRGRVFVASAGLAVSALALGGCSSTGATSLATVSTPPAATSSTSATAGATTSVAPSTSATADPSAPPTTLAMVREPVPPTVPPDAAPVVEAWFAYWEFLGKAIANPQDATVVEGLGTVATGSAASDSATQIGDLKAKNRHTVGRTQVSVSQAAVTGTTGSVCSLLRDQSFDVDASGTPVEAVTPRQFTFTGALVQEGGHWRVQKLTRVDAC